MKDNQVITDQWNLGHKYVPIGPDLRYIGKLPTSENNNFEEEYLLGEDKQIQRQYDSIEGCYKENIMYKHKNSDNKFYRLDYSEYDMRPERQDIKVKDDLLIEDPLEKQDEETLKINLHCKLENLSGYKLPTQWNKSEGVSPVVEIESRRYIEYDTAPYPFAIANSGGSYGTFKIDGYIQQYDTGELQEEAQIKKVEEIGIFRKKYTFNIPFYQNETNEPFSGSTYFEVGECDDSTTENQHPYCKMVFSDNDQSHSNWIVTVDDDTFVTSKVDKVYIYSGADTFTDNNGDNISRILYFGICVLTKSDFNNEHKVYHFGCGMDLTIFESSKDVHIEKRLVKNDPYMVRKYNLYYNNAGVEELFSTKTIYNTYIENLEEGKIVEIITHEVPMDPNVLFENGRFNSSWAVNGLSLDNYDTYEASESGFTNGRNWFIQNTGRAESQYVTDLIWFIKDFYTFRPQLNNNNAIEVDNTASHTSGYCSSIFIPIVRGKIVSGKTIKINQRHTQGSGGFAINIFEKESSGGSEHLTMRGSGGAGGPATTAQNTLTANYSISKDIDYIEIQTYNGCITEISKIWIE